MNNEIWKPVVGKEGLYEVSNLGRVKSLERYTTGKGGCKRKVNERILKFGTDLNGYYILGLNDNKTVTVHRLVAKAFIPNTENKRTVNHKNGIKTDNRLENLEWATHSEQVNHSIGTLGNSHISTGRLTRDEVVKIRELYDGKHGTTARLARIFSVTPANIYYIVRRKSWKGIV